MSRFRPDTYFCLHGLLLSVARLAMFRATIIYDPIILCNQQDCYGPVHLIIGHSQQLLLSLMFGDSSEKVLGEQQESRVRTSA